MVDTAIPKSQRTGKMLIRIKNGVRYYKRGGYPCEICPYAEEKVCANCVFAVWNVHGIKAGFNPKDAYRHAHRDDVSNSPLMQQLKHKTPLEYGLGNNNVLPRVKLPFFPVASHNSIRQSLDRIRLARRQLG